MASKQRPLTCFGCGGESDLFPLSKKKLRRFLARTAFWTHEDGWDWCPACNGVIVVDRASFLKAKDGDVYLRLVKDTTP